MTTYDRLSPQDSMFLYLESPTNHMHVGGMMIFEDTGAAMEEICDHIEGRLHLVPRFRKKLMWVPLGQGRPIWVDDENFDLRYHVRHTGLPAPGGKHELQALVARLMSTQLDRSRPLWEIWIVDMPGDRRGVIQKTHHAVIDGISGVDVATVLLDLTPEPTQIPKEEWQPEPAPSPIQLLVDSVEERFTVPAEMARSLRAATRTPRAAAGRAGEIAQGLFTMGRDVASGAPRTFLRQKVGAYRRFDTCVVDLADVKQIKNRAGVTVNDVVLALATGGLRHLFLARGEPVDDLTLRAMVPVSIRAEDERNTLGNKVSAMLAELPLGVANPGERLQAIATWMGREKDKHEALGAEAIIGLADWAPPTLVSLAARLGLAEAGAAANLVVTNVPGPQFPLYFLGGKMLEGYPYVGSAGELPLPIAVLSYDGRLFFGITGDWDLIPDVALVAEGIEKSVGELLD